MPRRSQIDALDQAVQRMLEHSAEGFRLGHDRESELDILLGLARDLSDLPREDFKARLKSELEREISMETLAESTSVRQQTTVSSAVPKGYRTVTPYLVAQDGAGLIEFVKRVFDAKETFRGKGSAGGLHCELEIGDSKLMVGGGGPRLSWRGEGKPAALHVYVEDADAAYQRALEAGGISIQGPTDQPYGERSGSVKDEAGNYWYIATHKGQRFIPEGLYAVNPYLHPLHADPLISFLKNAFGAEEVARYASPDGVVYHASVKIGDSIVEMGEARGPYQPMASMFYLYVSDVDSTYMRAISAGALSSSEPIDQAYGDRTASVKDAFGYHWYIATHMETAT